MAKYELLPFPIGQTAFTGLTSSQFASTDKAELEGREFLVEDLDYSQSVPKPRAFYGSAGANRFKKVRVVRNASGVSLLPRMLVVMKPGSYGGQVDGYGYVDACEAYPVDEFLPSGGVAANDLFYITVEGCAEVLTSLSGNAQNLITATTAGTNVGAGNWLVALTAAASTTSTTAGRVQPITLTGATAPLAANVINRVGIALSAMTTAQTNTACLAYVKHW